MIRYAAQGRAATGDMAAAAEARLADDKAMSRYYNETLAGGKWKGFQTQPKIGYGGNYPDSGWQQSERNNTGELPRDEVGARGPTLPRIGVHEPSRRVLLPPNVYVVVVVVVVVVVNGRP
ncbi:hypothetical protein WME73_18695 [Sorangium sp. So ce302]|uniref:hypothetical protein n=1 Tax=unclassified Sorangium TaxID=2621164 RepID=UPI003F60D000